MARAAVMPPESRNPRASTWHFWSALMSFDLVLGLFCGPVYARLALQLPGLSRADILRGGVSPPTADTTPSKERWQRVPSPDALRDGRLASRDRPIGFAAGDLHSPRSPSSSRRRRSTRDFA